MKKLNQKPCRYMQWTNLIEATKFAKPQIPILYIKVEPIMNKLAQIPIVQRYDIAYWHESYKNKRGYLFA